jgi:nucleoside-diphosphate-sugar epimerase
MDRVLITGATGFVGACLTEDLVREGHQVNILVRSTSNLWRLNKVIHDLNIIQVDLCDESGIDKAIREINPDVIFHSATYGGFPFQQETSKIIHTNIMGTANLVNACSNIDYRCFVNIGSSSEYGPKSEPMSEKDLLEPINSYGVTKSAATLYCQMLAKTQKRPIVTARLFSPYGYYEDKTRLISSVIIACLTGQNPQLASGDAVRDFIFIEDTLELLKIISQKSDVGGKIYNIGSGKQHSVAEMVNAIIQQSGANVTPEWGSIPGRKSDTAKWEADMDLVTRELHWQPKFTLESGVSETIQWFKENLDLYR